MESMKSGSDKIRKQYHSSVAPCKCTDKAREELLCPICLKMLYKPTTTPCGHSFCRVCLRSALEKCNLNCPICRQTLSYNRCNKVSTVLWNTIKRLFPQDVKERKEADSLNCQMARNLKLEETDGTSTSTRLGYTATRRNERSFLILDDLEELIPDLG